MNVLVAYASKHGSTKEIASAIAEDLRAAGIEVEMKGAEEVESVAPFDAVVLGSAIYIGQWQPAAMRMIDQFSDELRARPVWLFSSGPIGDDPFPREEPPITAELLEKTGAIEHQSFTGRLDRSALGFGERLVTSVLRAPEGDFRDWDAIRVWAGSIALTLQETAPSATETAV